MSMEPGTQWLPPPPAAPQTDPPQPAGFETPYPPHARYPAYPPYPPHPPQPLPPFEQPKQSRLARRFGPIAAALIALLAKLKAVLLLLPKIKVLSTAGTMAVSIAAYALIWGWAFAVGFVVLLLVHEMGHVIALRREGIKASAPMFIPFLGAVITSRSLGDNATAEARVGLAGPILGSIGSAACILIWHATGNDLWRALAFTGFLLNLFNLLPVVPLDGGRAMAAMAPAMWFVGFLALIPLLFFFHNPIFLLIVLFAGRETYRRWKLRRSGNEAQERYYRVRPRDRALIAVVYLGLIALLVVGMHATNLPRTIP
jgi:Zn-dependent protease